MSVFHYTLISSVVSKNNLYLLVSCLGGDKGVISTEWSVTLIMITWIYHTSKSASPKGCRREMEVTHSQKLATSHKDDEVISEDFNVGFEDQYL